MLPETPHTTPALRTYRLKLVKPLQELRGICVPSLLLNKLVTVNFPGISKASNTADSTLE